MYTAREHEWYGREHGWYVMSLGTRLSLSTAEALAGEVQQSADIYVVSSQTTG